MHNLDSSMHYSNKGQLLQDDSAGLGQIPYNTNVLYYISERNMVEYSTKLQLTEVVAGYFTNFTSKTY